LHLLKETKLKAFSGDEMEFLLEYERVMAPLASKLDILQGDKDSFLGVLIPHIIHLEYQLKKLLNGESGILTYTREMVETMLSRLCAPERFGPILENDDYKLASCFHPAYKLNWLRMWNPQKLSEIRDLMITMVADEIRAQDPEKHPSHPVTAERRRKEAAAADRETASTSAGMRAMPVDVSDANVDLTTLFNSYQEEADLLEAPQKTFTEKAKELVNMWEKSPATKSLDDAAFMDSPVLVECFMKTNTGVVSSAACERFFSMGKDTMRPKRETMSACNFEGLMFLRGNAHLWAVPKAQKRREVAKRRPHPLLEYLANEKN
jgi:hypothetical protein